MLSLATLPSLLIVTVYLALRPLYLRAGPSMAIFKLGAITFNSEVASSAAFELEVAVTLIDCGPPLIAERPRRTVRVSREPIDPTSMISLSPRPCSKPSERRASTFTSCAMPVPGLETEIKTDAGSPSIAVDGPLRATLSNGSSA